MATATKTHWHVGHNTAGCLPDNMADILTAYSAGDALDMMRDESEGVASAMSDTLLDCDQDTEAGHDAYEIDAANHALAETANDPDRLVSLLEYGGEDLGMDDGGPGVIVWTYLCDDQDCEYGIREGED